MKKTMEPFWWTLFGLGGTIAAFFIPIQLFFHGLAIFRMGGEATV